MLIEKLYFKISCIKIRMLTLKRWGFLCYCEDTAFRSESNPSVPHIPGERNMQQGWSQNVELDVKCKSVLHTPDV